MSAARVTRLLSICLAAVLLTGALAAADVLPHGLKVEKFIDSTAHLGDLAHSPTGELWLLERDGSVRVFEGGKQVASLSIAVSTACDAGLLDVAFAQDYGQTGAALVYYVDTTGEARVDEIFRTASGLSLGAKILSVGSNTGGCRMGGGMATAPDGTVYVATGDLETSADAQLDSSLSGKVLRMNFDGSIPADNPDPASLVFAKGFRQGADLAVNASTARANGTLYGADLGSGTVFDEINAVRAGGNYAWDANSGNTGGSYDDPLVAYNPVVGTEAVVALPTAGFGAEHAGSTIYACTVQDEVREAFLGGAERDVLDHTAPFFDPDADRDGTADAGCPHGVHAMTVADDGLLYMANDGANPGVWRVWHDTPGPREVSAPGSLVQLTASAASGDVTLGWEKLSTLDAGLPARNGAQHAETYTVWEGGLPIAGSYSHSPALTTDGAPDGPARLTATLTPAAGNRYFLVSAQGDNMEGTTGADSAGAARPTGHDYCDDIGWAHATGKCAPDFQRADGTPVKLIDENPASPTFGQALSMADFRGNVVRMDISADNCFWCRQQAPNLAEVERLYGTRDVEVVTVFLYQYGGHTAYGDEATCAADVAAWASQYNATGPILCDVPTNPDAGDMHGVVSTQYGRGCGTPENFYIDQSGVFYDYACGAELSAGSMIARIEPEANAETCE